MDYVLSYSPLRRFIVTGLLASFWLILAPLVTTNVHASSGVASDLASDTTAYATLESTKLAGIQAVGLGETHSCALTDTGVVKCWGDNEYGQLGNGTTTGSTTPVDVVDLDTIVVAIAVGESHTCALTNAGAVKCWGRGDSGQLGDGILDDSARPVDVVGLSSGVTAISAGYDHSCAVTAGGGVKCWGGNEYGHLGDGTLDDRSTPVDVDGLSSGVADIGSGLWLNCALTTTGGVKCWGLGGDGQLGNGDDEPSLSPVNVSGLTTGVTSIAVGALHVCALTTGGGVKCWGNGVNGQLGNGNDENSLTPVDVSGLTSGVALLNAGDSHSCVLTSDGDAKCWGFNGSGELGNGATAPKETTPVDVLGLGDDVTLLSLGSDHSCALTSTGGLQCWGANEFGELGNGTTDDSLTPVDVVEGTTQPVELPVKAGSLVSGDTHTCVVTTLGGVLCWGKNDNGQLGDATNISRTVPVKVNGLPSGVAAIGAGNAHSCAVTDTGAVKCWGNNGGGRLGDGNSGVDASSNIPVNVVGLSASATVDGGTFHTCALTDTGGVKCWGNNAFDQLGGDTNSPTPIDVAGLTSGVAQLSSGYSHNCVVTDGGGVKCWGWNNSGQLGDGTTDNRNTPVDVTGLTSGVASVSAGRYHTCAVTDTGGVKCWGRGGEGQLGNGGAASNTPVNVSGLSSGVVAVSAGDYHTCAITDTGAVKCWGRGGSGQLGNDGTGTRTTPVDVVDLDAGMAAVSAGADHTCALSRRGQVYCWGDNEFGQLGDGTMSERLAPVEVLFQAESSQPTDLTESVYLPNTIKFP